MKFAVVFSLCLGLWGAPCLSQNASPHRTHVEWEKTSLHLVAPGGNYARMIRLKNGTILCGYGDGRGLWVKRSRDNAQTWDEGTLVAPKQATGNFANAELLLLRGGDVLLFANFRPFKNQLPSPTPPAFSIGVARSQDGGARWSPVEIVHKAGTEFGDGCWEPSGVQLPSGEVQLFFADEGPYTRSNEQQISRMRSFDRGKTWTAPRPASFRAGQRDGMPVPVLLRSGNLVVAIEDSGLSGSFKPVIVQTQSDREAPSKTSDAPVVEGASAARWGALETPLEARVYAGAPYLRQLPSGETLLSFQQADDGNIDHSQMVVCLGDAGARHFGAPTRPFAGFSTSAQLWSSLLVKDKSTVAAMTSTKIGDVFGVWPVEGKIVRDKR